MTTKNCKREKLKSDSPLDFDINFSLIVTVAPRVEIQMNFWKGAKIGDIKSHGCEIFW